MLHLGVEFFVIDKLKRDNPGQSGEASQVLCSWLNAKPGTGVPELTWRSVLEALERSRHRQLTDKLRREKFDESSDRLISEPTSLPSMRAAVWRGCS